jgi:transmembrane sensor
MSSDRNMSASDDTPPGADGEKGNAALDWAIASGDAPELVASVRARIRQRRNRRWAIAASCSAIALLVFAPWSRTSIQDAPHTMVAAAEVPRIIGPSTQTLPDGSRIELREGSRFRLQYTEHERRIVLEEGEAYFAVVKDPARSFVVAVDGIEVRAVGTEFTVGRGEKLVDVVVTHGRVEVDHVIVNLEGTSESAVAEPDVPAVTIASLDAGKRVVIEVGTVQLALPQVLPISPDVQAERLAWRVPRLELAGTPLREVIPHFNRFGVKHLVLDPALNHLRVSGVVSANDTESLLILLRNEFQIAQHPRADGAIVLTR